MAATEGNMPELCFLGPGRGNSDDNTDPVEKQVDGDTGISCEEQGWNADKTFGKDFQEDKGK